MTLIQAAAMAAVAHLKIDYYIDTPLPIQYGNTGCGDFKQGIQN